MGAIDGVVLTPLKKIEGSAGMVMHVLKQTESTFSGFGEAYFSTVKHGNAKAWRMHTKMSMNIVVPVGSIQFVLYDERKDSSSFGQLLEVTLSPNDYQRLTVPPGIWMAFKGESTGLNLLLDIASLPHDPNEAVTLPLENDRIPYKGFSK